MGQTYIIEHLEPELWDWCFIEYKHISQTVGKENLWFTNLKDKKDREKLSPYGKVYAESLKLLELQNSCILDPEAPLTLTPKDAKSFNYFIFGGILGDHPPRKRTQEELTPFLKGEPRNIGKDQFSTDNAVYVTKQIADGTPLEKIPFQDSIEIDIDEIESTILPYKYALVNNKPFISQELVEYIKKKDSEE